MFKKIRKYKNDFELRRKYSTKSRIPFYDLAGNYLPKDNIASVVDIGCGFCEFAKHLNLKDKYEKLYLLDGSEKTVKSLEEVEFYRVPNKMFFKDSSIDFIHCSHLVEHLYAEQLHDFLKEIDRVLKKNGILVISTPLLWYKFFGNMSHIKPYYPQVFISYLCRKKCNASNATADPTYGVVSRNYKVEELVYRYKSEFDKDTISFSVFVIDLLLIFFRKVFFKLGFKKYIKTGYTIVLRKG